MRLAVFGATGGTGRRLVEQALARGHTVRALVRNPDHTGLPDAVDLVRGSILDATPVLETVAGANAVLSCLGAKLAATFAPKGRILAYAMTRIVEAMAVHGVRRVIAVSTYGAGESWQQLGLGARLLMGTLLWGELADKNAMEAVVRASGLDWTIVRPVNLKDGPGSLSWRVDPADHIRLSDRIARADVAAFMLRALQDQASFGRAHLIRNHN